MADDKKAKPLTAEQVICRVTGCGPANAATMLARIDMPKDKIVEAYHAGPDAIQQMLATMKNKSRPPRDFKSKQAPTTP